MASGQVGRPEHFQGKGFLSFSRERAFLASHQLEATLSNHQNQNLTLAHCGPNMIQRSISHERVAGLAPPLDSSLTICESCLKGKAHRMKDRKDLRAMIQIA
jgi:hypothetical protein